MKRQPRKSAHSLVKQTKSTFNFGCALPVAPRAAVRSLAAFLLVGSTFAADNFWVGGVSNDWNNAANWSLGRVPVQAGFGDSAAVNTSTGNIATISASVPQVQDIRVGESNTPGTIGTLIHTGGTLASGGGNWTAIGAGTGVTGNYRLTGTAAAGGTLTGFAQGSGTLNANSRLYVGGTDDGNYSVGGTGTLNVNTTGGIAATDTIFLGVRGATGTINLDSGAITTTNQVQVGVGAGGTGTVNIAGGSLGTTTGGYILIGNGGSGTVNVTGGTLGAAGGGRIHVGNGGNGSLNVSGTGTVNTGSDLIIAANGSTGTLTQTGGTINAGGWVYVGATFEGDNNSGTLNISGGTLNKGAGRLYIGVSNTNGPDTTVGQMTVSGTGVYNSTDQFIVGGNANTTSTLSVTGSGQINSG